MPPITRFLWTGSLLLFAVVVHRFLLDSGWPLAAGLAFMSAVWAGRIWAILEGAA